jgi:transglutaminase-like putative cysteine protease
MLQLTVGCRFDHDAVSATPIVVLVEPHVDVLGTVLEEGWVGGAGFETGRYTDIYGNRCRRFMLPEGASTLEYRAVVTVPGEPEPMPGPDDVQHRIEHLADGLLHWLLPSRFCESDTFGDRAWELFGHVPAGPELVQAICDWIHENVEYGIATLPTTTVTEAFEQRGGVCRDFAHIGVTFCRALGIPARYVFGYMPDIEIEGPIPVMDFHAWFEVWLGSSWWTYDARFNVPRIGRVPIGRGRDAADVAMITTYGEATLREMTVWADETAVTGGR